MKVNPAVDQWILSRLKARMIVEIPDQQVKHYTLHFSFPGRETFGDRKVVGDFWKLNAVMKAVAPVPLDCRNSNIGD